MTLVKDSTAFRVHHEKAEEMMSTADGAGPMEPAEAFRVTDLVGVAASAIVSRAVMKAAGGSVTLFAFAAGQELSEHTAPFDALVHVVAGRIELAIGGTPVVVAAGEIALMPARVPHGLRALDDTTMLLTMLRERGEDRDGGS